MKTLLAFAAFCSATALAAQETREAVPGAKPPPARVADLAWLAGQWEGEGISGPAVEVYSPPMGGQIAGHFVQLKGKDGVAFFEILSIAEVGGSLEYRLKHFNADLTGWEEKAEVRRFPLVAVTTDAWYFDGLTIRRDGPRAMIAAVKVRMDDGTAKEFVFRYRRSDYRSPAPACEWHDRHESHTESRGPPLAAPRHAPALGWRGRHPTRDRA